MPAASNPSASAGDVAASSAASAPAASASGPRSPSIEIRLPPGADSDAVREAVEEARAAVAEAIREAQEEAREAAEEVAAEAGGAKEQVKRAVRRARTTRFGDFLTELAWLMILASAILKITYKGKMQAEVKAAVATETAESEQLKRQVVEARMAGMQAQVEPHFLFNTAGRSTTDPGPIRRAPARCRRTHRAAAGSMPSMRESHPGGHNLGREIAVVRPTSRS